MIADDVERLLLECGQVCAAQARLAADEVESARGLLGHALARLREEMAELMPVVHGERRERLREILVALQAEDAVAQMLVHVRERTQAMGRPLDCMTEAAVALARVAGQAGTAESDRQLSVLHAGLCERAQSHQSLHALHPPVAQRRVATGAIDIF